MNSAPTPSPTPGPSRLPTPSQDELEAILKAANAGPGGRGLAVPSAPPAREREQVDEKCWMMSCKQTNAKRALGREPTCTAWCYINMRKQISKMKPVPGLPGAYLGHDVPIPETAVPPIKSNSPAVEEDKIPAYRWPFLDGRYIYKARGRKYVIQHLNEMGGEDWKGIEAIQERCDEAKEKRSEPAYREERMMKKAMGMELDDDYESLTSLSTFYSNSLRRFHAHIVRIYSPGINNLLRLPSTFTDGTQSQMLSHIWTKLSDGSAFVLAGRMLESTKEVSKRLRERRNGGEGGEGGIDPPSIPGLGGGPPPVSPPP